jgi:hypothetical protein
MAHVRKFLDLSTNHLMEDDREFLRVVSLSDESPIVPRAQTATGGCFMYADEASEINLPDTPHRICIIMIHARQHGCDYVLFDANGPEDPDLPVFGPPRQPDE